MRNLTAFLSLTLLMTVSACGRTQPADSTLNLRPLTKAEAHADLSELVEKVRALYGPLTYKEARFGFKLDEVASAHQSMIDVASSDEELQGVFAKFLARFDDAHVGISFFANSSGVSSYVIPAFLTPVDGHAIITTIDPSLVAEGLEAGDEVLSIDGVAPFDLLPVIHKYRSIANEVSNKQLLYQVLRRPFFVTELKPTSGTAHIVVAKASGEQLERDLTWHVVPAFTPNITDLVKPTSFTAAMNKGFSVDVANEINAASSLAGIATSSTTASTLGMDKMGAVTPFFATKKVAAKFNLVRVTPNADYLKKYEIDPAKAPDIYAALYRYEGKTLLLVRQPSYSHDKETEGFSNEDYMNTYRAIFDQYESLVDGLVVDQTHNGGGSYCEDFFSLFIQSQKGGFVQKMHADRKWIIDMHDWAKEVDPTLKSEMSRSLINGANLIEKAYDAGLALSEPIALMGGHNLVSPDALYTWKKPFIVLVDELSASCADAFPLLIKGNNIAKIFGERTMGAGGNVEEVVQLSNSRAAVRMTRGLFSWYHADGRYPDADFVENNGVQPDYHYAHTVDDVRGGFTAYFDAFSKKMIEQIQ